ncbi:2`,3`-cyclic-nucleotide 2`-phosphodiesterase [Sulfitobacter noctilucicola]|uniref:2',3'-cyclic-nucleotide 2'-phosphodiesterase/3'-nucleotidase n=2 Tax=Sulfitobacter noctilucicola TaxID=1342301 RepID=A0A7W6Q4T9_9RHOB|nr:2`,3`-cyclic-nucleotide 2`-phosphodiesterase [Sulfitobacter noctilucicola]MBB4173065.1 2',3'-cyclic-nucleotide 2'-phosphodiesterase/3'-nucleotidase [Sulfitobacter noctilucicola]
MQFLGHNYVRDKPLRHHGLAGLATLIAEARAEAAADGSTCLLLDNGDLIQGAAIGDTCARLPVTARHPVVRCLEEMNYDAIGLGNHDLDHGLDYPIAIAAQTKVPVIATNLELFRQGPFVREVILPCLLSVTDHGLPQTLQIGVLSVLPDRTAQWNKASLAGTGQVHPPRRALEQAVTRVRGKGADIVILLAHLGVGDIKPKNALADDALDLARVEGVDAIIAGHTHRRLPGFDHAGMRDVDEVRGTLACRPAAMPGFDASDLAVLDLHLRCLPDGKWRIEQFENELRPNSANVLPDPAIAEICAPAHTRTRNELETEIGHTPVPLHNFFSLAAPTNTTILLARAKAQVVRAALQGTPEGNLPLLAATAAHTAGGRAGPDHFLHIPKGPVMRRHLTGLSPFANEICALHLTGVELREWLEHSLSVYHRLDPKADKQSLICEDRPTFEFDTIFGLTYSVDPTRMDGHRLTSLKYANTTVTDRQDFILATNLFRASGGGGGQHFQDSAIVHHAKMLVSDALEDLLKQPHQTETPFADTAPWQFDVPQETRAVLRTSPEALPYLNEIACLAPRFLNIDAEGFAAIQLTL